MKYFIVVVLLIINTGIAGENPSDCSAKMKNWIMEKAIQCYELAEKNKDHEKQLVSLKILSKFPKAPLQYKFKRAELILHLSGVAGPLAELVHLHPFYVEGKEPLVRHYFNKKDYRSLRPYEKYMSNNLEKDLYYLKPLFHYYASEGNYSKAHHLVYTQAEKSGANKDSYMTIWSLAQETSSPFMAQILEIGQRNHRTDAKIVTAYGNSRRGLDSSLYIYKTLHYINKYHLPSLQKGAELAMAMGRHRDAVPYLINWRELEPKELAPNRLLVRAQSKSKQKEELMEAYERLSAFEVYAMESLEQLVEYNLKEKNSEKAIHFSSRALALAPHDKRVQGMAIRSISSTGKKGLMKNAMIHIQNLDPKAHEIQYQLSRIFLEDADPMQAAIYLKKALKNRPDQPEYLELLPLVAGHDSAEESGLPTISQAIR